MGDKLRIRRWKDITSEEIEDGHWYLITSEMLERDTEGNQRDDDDWDVADDEDIKALFC